MVKRFVVPFATSGDKTATPDATDPGGAISYAQGWPVAYQLADTDPAYRPVGRQEMNGVLNDITGAISELQVLGYPEWVAVTGLVAPYVINAEVRHNAVVWRNTVANNSAEPGVGAGWVNASIPTGRLLRTTVYSRTAGGVQQISVDGAAPTTTAAGSFTKHPDMQSFKIRGMGGGGAGGGSPITIAGNVGFGNGGHAGAYGEGVYAGSVAASPLSIVVGIGATGTNGYGADGSASTVGPGGVPFTAGGGPGGPNVGNQTPPLSGANGTGAASCTGANLISGRGPTAPGMAYIPTTASGFSGGGASTQYGAGGLPRNTTGAGNAAVGIGAGGGGGLSFSATATAQLGGNGGHGFIEICEYS